MVSGARRRALRDGDRVIDTAHLLHSLLECDPEVRAVFESGPQLARLLAYLVQRSIGYGLRWQGGVEDSGAVPVVTQAEGFSPWPRARWSTPRSAPPTVAPTGRAASTCSRPSSPTPGRAPSRC